MATRLILTLLALLTGLVAQLSPAQARSGAELGVEVSATALGAQRQLAQQSGAGDRQSTHPRVATRLSALFALHPPALVATVLPGIDRARE